MSAAIEAPHYNGHAAKAPVPDSTQRWNALVVGAVQHEGARKPGQNDQT
jgi:hypothetical protein